VNRSLKKFEEFSFSCHSYQPSSFSSNDHHPSQFNIWSHLKSELSSLNNHQSSSNHQNDDQRRKNKRQHKKSSNKSSNKSIIDHDNTIEDNHDQPTIFPLFNLSISSILPSSHLLPSHDQNPIKQQQKEETLVKDFSLFISYLGQHNKVRLLIFIFLNHFHSLNSFPI